MPLPKPKKKPDAVLYTTAWLHDPTCQGINKEIGPILGCERCECWDAGGVFFATADTCDKHGIHHTLYYHKGHPKAGQDKYDWHEAVPGVMYGYLLPDDSTREESLSRYEVTLKAAQARREAEATKTAAQAQADAHTHEAENELA